MANIADKAQQEQAHYLLGSLARIPVAKPQGPSLEHCESCGETISQARREAVLGCRLCVKCQEQMDGK